MTSNNSAARSKSEARQNGSCLRRILIFLALMLILIATAGPTVFLNIVMAGILPSANSSLSIDYDRARAGILFRSISIHGLRLEKAGGKTDFEPISIDFLRLDGISLIDLAGFVIWGRRDENSAWPLAEEIIIQGLSQKNGLNIDRLSVRGPALPPAEALDRTFPLWFDKLEISGLDFSSTEIGGDRSAFRISQLEARALGLERLGSLKATGAGLMINPKNDLPVAATLDGLTAGGIKTEAVARAFSGGDGLLSVLWALSSCDTLDLARLTLTRNNQEALNLKKAVFDFHQPNGNLTVYNRRLDFSVDFQPVSDLLNTPSWDDFRSISGDRFDGLLDAAVEHNRADSSINFRQVTLDSPELGRLDVSGNFKSVSTTLPKQSGWQLVFAASGWRLEGLTAEFANKALMLNLYRHLDRTVFKQAPSRNSADNIMKYTVMPLAEVLEADAALDNLPALVSEVQAFLNNPQSLKLSANPERALSLGSLANLDKYDIIDKLRLTIEVNGRAPVAVAVASGVFHERLPSATRPMEHLFEEDDI